MFDAFERVHTCAEKNVGFELLLNLCNILPPTTNLASASFNFFNQDGEIFFLFVRNCEKDGCEFDVAESEEELCLAVSTISFFQEEHCSKCLIQDVRP